MLDKYKGTGWKKPYLIYAMCDETFSVNYTAEIPEGVDRGWFYFFVSLLDEFTGSWARRSAASSAGFCASIPRGSTL